MSDVDNVNVNDKNLFGQISKRRGMRKINSKDVNCYKRMGDR